MRSLLLCCPSVGLLLENWPVFLRTIERGNRVCSDTLELEAVTFCSSFKFLFVSYVLTQYLHASSDERVSSQFRILDLSRIRKFAT